MNQDIDKKKQKARLALIMKTSRLRLWFPCLDAGSTPASSTTQINKAANPQRVGGFNYACFHKK